MLVPIWPSPTAKKTKPTTTTSSSDACSGSCKGFDTPQDMPNDRGPAFLMSHQSEQETASSENKVRRRHE